MGLLLRSIFVLALVSPFVPRALAANAEAEALLREGRKLNRHFDHAGALERFRRAYEIERSPLVLARIGLTEEALGRWAAAHRHLSEAMEVGASDPWFKLNRAVFERSLWEIGQRVGMLDVIGEPKGAEIRVDGDLVGALPLPRPVAVAAGGAVLEVSAPGHVPVTRAINMRAGQQARESFSLRPVSREASAHPGEPRAPPPNDRAGAWRAPAQWATAIAATAALGWGIAETLIWQGKIDSFNAIDECDLPARDKGGLRCATLYDEGERAKVLAFVGYGLAAAFAATSVVLILTRPAADVAPAKHTLTCGPARAGVGASCTFRF
jgi:tetratricopeptide (TPR) repeat protein